MGPAYYVLAIFGCGDGGHACQPVVTMSERYATRDACVASSVGALYDQRSDFPELVARCERNDAPRSGAMGPESHNPAPTAG